MQNRIVEIASDGMHLSLSRGFMKVARNGEETGSVPLPDIGALIVRGYGTSVSLNLVAKLAELNVPMVLCGTDQSPASVLWPISGHHAQGHTIEGQAGLTLPRRKRLWQSLVRAKITSQVAALGTFSQSGSDLSNLANRVKSGDPENIEAQAARRYWPRMMGTVEDGFARNRNGSGINSALNYGYTVLRAAAARSILAAGLHPSLSIHHVSRGDPLRLADDIMEPFRPYVDIVVRRLGEKVLATGKEMELDRNSKLALVDVLSIDLSGPFGASPLQTCMDRLCQSLAAVCRKERQALELPGSPVFSSPTVGEVTG
jgi:CRISPR-associated protein Cas1